MKPLKENPSPHTLYMRKYRAMHPEDAEYQKEYQLVYQEEHREELAEKRRQKRLANLEEVRALDRERKRHLLPPVRERKAAWFQDNKTRLRDENAERARLRYQEDPDRYRAQLRAYRQTPSGKACMANSAHKRRAAYDAASDDELRACRSMMQAWRTVGAECYFCGGALSPDEVQVDHRIPIARGGSHSPENIEPICARCNHSKGAKVYRFGYGS